MPLSSAINYGSSANSDGSVLGPGSGAGETFHAPAGYDWKTNPNGYNGAQERNDPNSPENTPGTPEYDQFHHPGGGGGLHAKEGASYFNQTSPDSGKPKPGQLNSGQFGGQYGMANQIAQQYGDQAAQYANRQIGSQLSAPMNQAQAAARAQQMQSQRLLYQAAQGQGTSAAAVQQSAGLSGALANQFAAMHSARGPGGLASGIAASQPGLASASAAAIGQGAQNRAQELSTAQGQFMQGANAMRGQDISALTTDQQRELQQAQMNQGMQLGSQGLSNSVLQQQLGADTSAFGMDTTGQMNLGTQALIGNMQMNQNLETGAAGAASGLASALAPMVQGSPGQPAQGQQQSNPYGYGDSYGV